MNIIPFLCVKHASSYQHVRVSQRTLNILFVKALVEAHGRGKFLDKGVCWGLKASPPQLAFVTHYMCSNI